MQLVIPNKRKILCFTGHYTGYYLVDNFTLREQEGATAGQAFSKLSIVDERPF